MQLIIVIIFLTGLWISFGLPYILSRIESRSKSLIDTKTKIEILPNIGPSDGPDFYDYYEDNGQLMRAEKGSIIYMLIYQSLSRRR